MRKSFRLHFFASFASKRGAKCSVKIGPRMEVLSTRMSTTLALAEPEHATVKVQFCCQSLLVRLMARPNVPSSELENEPGLEAEIVLVVVPCGEVVNETRQKIIGFDRPDRQVRSDFNVETTP